MIVNQKVENSLFIRMLAKEYESAISQASDQIKNNKDIEDESSAYLSTESVTRLRNWFMYLVKTVKIRVGDKEVTPGEAIMFIASKGYDENGNEIFPVVKRILYLFTDEEMLDMFGQSIGSFLIKTMETA